MVICIILIILIILVSKWYILTSRYFCWWRRFICNPIFKNISYNLSRNDDQYIIKLFNSIDEPSQLEASVYTQGFERNPGFCSVRIGVNRNLNSPIFNNGNLIFSVFEYEPIGYEITQLVATDADFVSLRLEIRERKFVFS